MLCEQQLDYYYVFNETMLILDANVFFHTHKIMIFATTLDFILFCSVSKNTNWTWFVQSLSDDTWVLFFFFLNKVRTQVVPHLKLFAWFFVLNKLIILSDTSFIFLIWSRLWLSFLFQYFAFRPSVARWSNLDKYKKLGWLFQWDFFFR